MWVTVMSWMLIVCRSLCFTWEKSPPLSVNTGFPAIPSSKVPMVVLGRLTDECFNCLSQTRSQTGSFIIVRKSGRRPWRLEWCTEEKKKIKHHVWSMNKVCWGYITSAWPACSSQPYLGSTPFSFVPSTLRMVKRMSCGANVVQK